jgi:hypothetical protein
MNCLVSHTIGNSTLVEVDVLNRIARRIRPPSAHARRACAQQPHQHRCPQRNRRHHDSDRRYNVISDATNAKPSPSTPMSLSTTATIATSSTSAMSASTQQAETSMRMEVAASVERNSRCRDSFHADAHVGRQRCSDRRHCWRRCSHCCSLVD